MPGVGKNEALVSRAPRGAKCRPSAFPRAVAGITTSSVTQSWDGVYVVHFHRGRGATYDIQRG